MCDTWDEVIRSIKKLNNNTNINRISLKNVLRWILIECSAFWNKFRWKFSFLCDVCHLYWWKEMDQFLISHLNENLRSQYLLAYCQEETCHFNQPPESSRTKLFRIIRNILPLKETKKSEFRSPREARSRCPALRTTPIWLFKALKKTQFSSS